MKNGKGGIKLKEEIEKHYAKLDDNGGVRHDKEYWKRIKIIAGIVIFLLTTGATILPLLTYMGGLNRNIILKNKDIKDIPGIKSEVKTLTERVGMVESQAKEIPNMNAKIDATQIGVATLNGKVDVLLSRGR